MALFSWSADMASLLRCFKGEVVQKKTKQHCVDDYDKTFVVTKAILKLVGLRLMRQDSNLTRLAWNIYYWFSFVNLIIAGWLELVHMVMTARGGSFQDAIDIFRMMPCIGYVLLAIVKSYNVVYHRPIYENLFTELRGMWPQGPVSDEEHRIISSALKKLNIIIQGYYWCNNVLLAIFMSPPFMVILQRALGRDVPLTLPFFYWFPFDPFAKGCYVIILALQTWHGTAFSIGLIAIWLTLCGDLLFCIYLSHITTQFDLLSVRIKKMVHVPIDKQLVEEFPLATYSKEYVLKQKRSIDSFGDEDWEKVHQRDLAAIIERHRALIRLSKDVEDMFSFAMLVNFFNSSIIICFCGFCCVVVEKWNEIVYKLFLTTALTQTWLLCWYGQRLLESSNGVSHALYNSGWYTSSNKIRSSILIMLHRSQKNIQITTYGFSVVSLASYSTIIKTAWSYFTLLLNIYKQ